MSNPVCMIGPLCVNKDLWQPLNTFDLCQKRVHAALGLGHLLCEDEKSP